MSENRKYPLEFDPTLLSWFANPEKISCDISDHPVQSGTGTSSFSGQSYQVSDFFNYSYVGFQSNSQLLPYKGYYFENKGASQKNPNLLNISALGINVLGFSNEMYLYIKNADLLIDHLKNGQFIAEYGGKKVYSLKFHGNQYFKPLSVATQKASFLKQTSVFKVLKAGGVTLGALSIVPSAIDVIKKKDAKSGFGLAMDIAFLGGMVLAGGIPGLVIAGAAVAIGIYEVSSGNDVSDIIFNKADLLVGDNLSEFFSNLKK